MSLLMEKSLREFNQMLAASEPTPGGGSTSALSGVLGAALSMMVVNLSVGKKAYEALEESSRHSVEEAFKTVSLLNKELTELVDEDTKAYKQYMEALKLPKETEEQRKKRAETIQEAAKYAMEVPLAAAEKCLGILKQQKTIALYGNRNAVSDVGVGALLALAGLEGAALNVKINLPGISDETVRKEAFERIEAAILEGRALKEETISLVNEIIAKF